MVTGCDTGLGQAWPALAEARMRYRGVNRKVPDETARALRRWDDALSRFAPILARGSIQSVVDTAVAEMGRIDILVNNAGTIRRADALEFSEKDWDEVIDLNLKSGLFLSQAVAKQFIAQGQGGKIINIASMLSFRAASGCPPIRPPKAACWASPACWRTNGRRWA